MKNIFFKNKYFPNQIDICLLVCTKNCSHAYLGTSNFIHYCDCGNDYCHSSYVRKVGKRKDFFGEKDYADYN